jgi:hypothetical protein
MGLDLLRFVQDGFGVVRIGFLLPRKNQVAMVFVGALTVLGAQRQCWYPGYEAIWGGKMRGLGALP